MAEKLLGPAGSKRRKRFLWVPTLLIACIALFVIGNAQAVHDLQFQLDGNTEPSCGTVLQFAPASPAHCNCTSRNPRPVPLPNHRQHDQNTCVTSQQCYVPLLPAVAT